MSLPLEKQLVSLSAQVCQQQSILVHCPDMSAEFGVTQSGGTSTISQH